MKNFSFVFFVVLCFTACRKSALKPHAAANANTSPAITYPATNNLTVGAPATIVPVNSGGAIPANLYGQVTTFSGSPVSDTGYMDGTGTAALFNSTQQTALDASGNLYVTDTFNDLIRKIDPSGVVTTVAGQHDVGGDADGQGTSATFYWPDGIAINPAGDIYIADAVNNMIRKITPAGSVSTICHIIATPFHPAGICLTASGDLLVTTYTDNQLVKVTSAGTESFVAGDPDSQIGFVDGSETDAKFNYPTDVTVDSIGNIYIADSDNNAIRKISTSGVVSTFAGSIAYQGANVFNNPGGFADGVGNAALFNNVTGLAMAPGGILYVTDRVNNDIRRIMPDATVNLIAGSAVQAMGNNDGLGTAARFNQPDYITIDKNSGIGYISEFSGSRIRKIVLTGYSITGTLPAGLSFDPKTGTISGTPFAAAATTTFTVSGFNTYGYSTNTFSITVN